MEGWVIGEISALFYFGRVERKPIVYAHDPQVSTYICTWGLIGFQGCHVTFSGFNDTKKAAYSFQWKLLFNGEELDRGAGLQLLPIFQWPLLELQKNPMQPKEMSWKLLFLWNQMQKRHSYVCMISILLTTHISIYQNRCMFTREQCTARDHKFLCTKPILSGHIWDFL